MLAEESIVTQKPYYFFTLILILFSAFTNSFAKNPPVIIYCRDAFASNWGETLTQKFPDELKILKMYGHGVMTRLRLEDQSTSADLLLGIDTTQICELEEKKLAAVFPYNRSRNQLPVKWPDTSLIPLGYGILTVLSHKGKSDSTIDSLTDLLKDTRQLVLPDPRTSTTGLEFLYWVHHFYSKKTSLFWQKLKPSVLTYTKGLSSSFALFSTSSKFLTVAYSTSASFAQHKKLNASIRPEIMQGAPVQVYGVVVTFKGTQHPLVSKIIDFLQSKEFQEKMYECDLYPVFFKDKNNTIRHWPVIPTDLIPPPFLSEKDKDALIQEWLEASQG